MMKNILLSMLLVAGAAQLPAQENRALMLDGKNSNMTIGMDTISNRWSIEMWVKGDDLQWKEREVLIGGGEYSSFNITDKFPLTLEHGKLTNGLSKIQAEMPLDDQWHHVAATCGDKGTRLYIDGKLVASSPVRSRIIPGVIGADEKSETVFGGSIDEVRIWKTELSQKTIERWMGIPLKPSHPNFSKLKGYYPFDEESGDYYTNWAGVGPLSFHARNYRINYKDPAPIVAAVPANNPKFQQTGSVKSMFNAVDIPSEWDAERGATEEQMLKLRIAVNGDKGKSLQLSEIALDLSANTSLANISKGTIYYTGNRAKSGVKVKLADFNPAEKLKVPVNHELSDGVNYFLVTFDLSPDSKVGAQIGAKVSSFKVNGKSSVPQRSADFYPKTIIPKTGDENIVKVLTWNIWHGGVHLGSDGPQHIVDLLRKCDADIVTMQEAYGSQDRFAKELNYKLTTNSAKDNLALFTRFKMLPLNTRNAFKSNPAIMMLPNGKRISVLDCWLRYAYRPGYASNHGNTGYDQQKWIEEDITLSKADISQILTEDVEPYMESADEVVIIGGDFNSGSHLDWTDAATPLHYGYGKVDLPTSKFMMEKGFKDSFREMHPNEVTHSGGTFAVIYGQLQHSRIDYIYYKGNGIRPLYSKTIRTAEEIDFVWAGDHAAVFTVFEVK
ncbi:MAG: LamG-like jellyroll fold domain-containing protein [Bacteroidales bacterium]